MARLSDPQVEALALLTQRRCYTARQTYGTEFIAGTVAKKLVADGLARYTSGWQIAVEGSTKVEITDAGKVAYEQIMRPPG